MTDFLNLEVGQLDQLKTLAHRSHDGSVTVGEITAAGLPLARGQRAAERHGRRGAAAHVPGKPEGGREGPRLRAGSRFPEQAAENGGLMISTTSDLRDRECRVVWVVDGDGHYYTQTEAYYCDNPADPARVHPYWWVPAIGYSIPEERLYATEQEAKDALLKRLRTDHAEIARKIVELEG